MKRATKRRPGNSRAQFIGGPVRPSLRLRYIGPPAPPPDQYDQIQIARLWPPPVTDSRAQKKRMAHYLRNREAPWGYL